MYLLCVSYIFHSLFGVLSRCTVLAFCENCKDPRHIKKIICLLAVIRHLEYYLGRILSKYFELITPQAFHLIYAVLHNLVWNTVVLQLYICHCCAQISKAITWGYFSDYLSELPRTRYIPGTFHFLAIDITLISL